MRERKREKRKEKKRGKERKKETKEIRLMASNQEEKTFAVNLSHSGWAKKKEKKRKREKHTARHFLRKSFTVHS